MKSILRAALVLHLLFTGVAHAGSDPATVNREIQARMDEMMLAANAHDTDRFMLAFEPGPGLVFTIQETIILGWPALREQQLKWWDGGKAKGEYRERAAPVFKVLGPDCVLTVQALVASGTLPDGTPRSRNFAVTSVWKKSPQGWRIQAAHESFAP